MNGKNHFLRTNQVGLVLCVSLLGALTGCVGYVDGPSAGVYAFAAQDDYVYYPNYECYYSVSRNQYAYREGNTWVARPAPPGVTVNALRASPSVKMDFHDSPANHHADVVKQYPKNWTPQASNQGQKQNHNGGQQEQNNGR
jgi:hypothetical protein